MYGSAGFSQGQSASSNASERTDDTYDTLVTTNYRSAVSPRVINVQRSRPTGLAPGSVTTRIQQSYSSTMTGSNPALGLAALVQKSGVPLRTVPNNITAVPLQINTNRQRDKRDLVSLNDKFAQYIERVRFLEAQNRKLAMELDALRSRTGQSTSRIKEMYDIEIAEADKLIKDTARDADNAKDKALQAEQDAQRLTARYNDLSQSRLTDQREIDAIQQRIAENEAQMALLRRRIADLEDETRIYKNEGQRLSSEIFRLQNEIQNEAFVKSSHEFEKMALEDEIATIKQTHEAELAELRAKNISTDLDPSLFFRNELAQAIRDIRKDYEAYVENQRNDLQNHYSILVNELVIRNQWPGTNQLPNEHYHRETERIRTDLTGAQSQNSQLRAKIQQLEATIADMQRRLQNSIDKDNAARAKHERDMNDARNYLAQVQENYNRVMEFKTSLEKEILGYRQLLEGPNGLQGCVDRIVQKNYESTGAYYLNSASTPSSAPSNTSSTVTRTYVARSSTNYGSAGVGGQQRPNPSDATSNQPDKFKSTYQVRTATPDSTYTNFTREYTARAPSSRPLSQAPYSSEYKQTRYDQSNDDNEYLSPEPLTPRNSGLRDTQPTYRASGFPQQSSEENLADSEYAEIDNYTSY